MVERRTSDQKVADPGSILELAMRRCVLRKDTLCLFLIGPKQSTRRGGPASRKTRKQNPKKCSELI